MPIPSLNLPLKPRTQATKAKDVPLDPKSSRSPALGSLLIDDVSNPSVRPPHSALPYLNTAAGAKRRSFLPQRGDLKHVPRTDGSADAARPRTASKAPLETLSSVARSNAVVSSQADSVQDIKEARLRPRSMYQASPARTEQSHKADREDVEQAVAQLELVHRSAATKPPMLTRSQSLRRPAAPMKPAQPGANARLHSRTHSTTTTSGPTKVEQQDVVQPGRPKSLILPRSGSVKVTAKGSTDAVSSGAGRLTRLTALKRAASLRTKPEAKDASDSASVASSASIEVEDQNLDKMPKSRDAKEDPKKQPRPAFSTLQRHFTPRKTGKAPTSTFLHPVAPAVRPDSIPPELIRVQAELLQLQILHQSSAQTSKQWEVSAKRNLRRKFEEVTSLYHVMLGDEREGQEQKNIRALSGWTGGHLSCGLAEHIQILSGPLQELPSLVDSGGRFGRLLGDFQRWMAWVEQISAAREEVMEGKRNELITAEGLGDAWKAENAALTRKLTSFSRDLDRLAPPTPGSSIATVVATCKQLVCAVLDELRVMQAIEADIVLREKEFVEAALKSIARDVGAHVDKGEDYGVWRL